MTFGYISISVTLKPDVTILNSPASHVNIDENKKQIKKIILHK